MNTEAPTLAEGEIHIATLQLAGQPGYHLILMPGEPAAGEVTWPAAREWATALGGDLPTRVEQSILFAHFRDQFERDWYWSNQQHESNEAYAWCQYFNNGYQYNFNLNLELRARAVRRLAI